MGQVALGFRSLLIKLAIFFVMAALLAWALGGTLWPRAEAVDLDHVSFAGEEYFWRLEVGGRTKGALSWKLMSTAGELPAEPVDGETWQDVAGPIVNADSLYIAVKRNGEPWRLRQHLADGTAGAHFQYPDRLAVERQLARVVAGLAIEDPETASRHRAVVLEPPEG